MKYIYRIIFANDSALHKMGEEGWQLCGIHENKMYFMKEEKKTREQKNAEQTPQYLQFKTLYPREDGITAQKVINMVDKIVKAGEFEALMKGVEAYSKKVFLEKLTPRFILLPATFLNNRRWEGNFNIMENRLPVSDQWMLPYLQQLKAEDGEKVLKIARDWEKKQNKDLNEGVLKNIILKVTGNEN